MTKAMEAASRTVTRSARVSGIGTTGSVSWPVRITVSNMRAWQPASAVSNWAAFGATAAFLLLTLIGWFLAGRIARPVERLSASLILDDHLAGATRSAWASAELHDIEAALRLGIDARMLTEQRKS